MDSNITQAMRNAKMDRPTADKAQRTIKHIIYGWCQWMDIAVVEETDELQGAVEKKSI